MSYILPHGPCCPCLAAWTLYSQALLRPCLVTYALPPAPANTERKRGKDCGGRRGFALCLHPCLLFRFFLLKTFYFYIIHLYYLFFIKKWKSRQKHSKPLCRNGFRVSTFLLPRPLFVDEATLAATP